MSEKLTDLIVWVLIFISGIAALFMGVIDILSPDGVFDSLEKGIWLCFIPGGLMNLYVAAAVMRDKTRER